MYSHLDRDEISADEQVYTVPEWTVMKSQQMNRGTQFRVDRDEISADEQGNTVTEWTVMKSQQMNRGTQSPSGL